MEVVNTTTTTNPVNMYSSFNNYMMNPIILIIIVVIIVAYFLFSSSLSSSDNLGNMPNIMPSNNQNKNGLGFVIIVILVIFFFFHALMYFFSINVSAYISGLFTPNGTVNIVVDQSTSQSSYEPAPVPEIRFKKQVFNIPGNYYSYDNAKALCQAYGSELATYDQIEKAYNKGAEWCNYGWSANNLALFPTQQKTYDNLQKIKGHENDCGRPGINGGYIANNKVRFGANCYGYKPKITQNEEELMKTATPYPETEEDIAFQKKVDALKNNLGSILVSPFNYDIWGAPII